MMPTEIDFTGQSPIGTQKLVYAEDQAEYGRLPAIRTPDGCVTSRWKLDAVERELLLQGADVYLTIHTFGTPAYAKGSLSRSRFSVAPMELTVGPPDPRRR